MAVEDVTVTLSALILQTDGRSPGGPEVAWECQGHGMWPVIDTC